MLKISDKLGYVLAIFSFISLAKHGFDLGSFVAPLRAAIEWYESFTHFVFGWAEPYLNDLLRNALSWTSWHVQVYPHWKHVFILMWLYFAADAKVWSFDRRRAVFLFGSGGFLAFVTSLAAGCVPLNNTPSNAIMAACAVGGTFLYGLGNAAFSARCRPPWSSSTYWQHFRYVARQPLLFALVGVTVIVIATQLSVVKNLPSSGLAVLFLLIIALALYYVFRGMWISTYNRHGDETWWVRFRRDQSAHLGFLMLKVIGGAVIFILANGGLKLAGL